VLGEPIGEGGFSVVYRAVDVMAPTGSEVAVKVLPPEFGLDAGTVARFHREMQLMSRLSHPNVMPVIASGTDDQAGIWYAMPIAIGSLADGLKMGMLPEEVIAAVMRDVCAGLAYIHGQGVLHRDLKPHNVLRTYTGAWAIADFGLARAVVESTRLTETASPLGTPLYMAPEQWADAKSVTAAADIFSAGKVLQAMLIGGPPVTDDIPQGKLAAVVRRAISRDPQRRHQNAGELLAAIEIAGASGQWEPSAEKAGRLRQHLAAGVDAGALGEIMKWADEAGEEDMRDFALALSAVPAWLVERWWQLNPGNFSHVFGLFARGMEGGFVFTDCDPVANFAHIAVTVTRDREILREAVRGLTLLGSNHNRWHVRDVAVGILQAIRDDADAASALEGLQMAGKRATEWTTGYAVLGTLHPILRTGIGQIRQSMPTF
jgi:eukaryotic-like serine/threonine-protein kinase